MRAGVACGRCHRANNVSISISRFKQTPEAIAKAILHGDPESLSADQLASLQTILPTAEDVEVVQGFDGPAASLGKAEQFFLSLAAVPRYAVRAKCMLTRANFDEKLVELSHSVEAVQQAAEQVRGSVTLRLVCEVTLAIGNYLNGGTAKGGAWGFKLDSLNKLLDTKSLDGKSTLLHYLARELDRQHGGVDPPELPPPLRLSAELSFVDAAARLRWKDECTEVSALSAGIEQVAAQVEMDKTGPFAESLGAFYTQASKQVSALVSKKDAADDACARIIAWFGEDKKANPEEVFSTLHNFMLSLEKARRYNVDCDEQELRRLKKEKELKLRTEKAASGEKAAQGEKVASRGKAAFGAESTQEKKLAKWRGGIGGTISGMRSGSMLPGGASDSELAAKLARRNVAGDDVGVGAGCFTCGGGASDGAKGTPPHDVTIDGAAGAALGGGGCMDSELMAKLARRMSKGDRTGGGEEDRSGGDLVDKIDKGMEAGTLLLERRFRSFGFGKRQQSLRQGVSPPGSKPSVPAWVLSRRNSLRRDSQAGVGASPALKKRNSQVGDRMSMAL